MTKTDKEIEDKYAELFDFLTEQLYLSSKKLPASIREAYVNTTLGAITGVIKKRVKQLEEEQK